MPGTPSTPNPPPAPCVVITAKAAIDGGVRIEPRAPEEVHVRTGQPLHIRLLYRLHRPATPEEDYHIHLESSLGSQVPDPATLAKGDRIGLPGELWGSIQQEYILHEPGDHQLTLTTRATYSGPRQAEASDRYETTVRVLVE